MTEIYEIKSRYAIVDSSLSQVSLDVSLPLYLVFSQAVAHRDQGQKGSRKNGFAPDPTQSSVDQSFSVNIKNTGTGVASDYVALLFASSTNAGPTPHPNKALVSYGRLHNIATGVTAQISELTRFSRQTASGELT